MRSRVLRLLVITIDKPTHHRYRYIAFSIHQGTMATPLTRNEIITALRSECKLLFRQPCSTYGIFLTRFDGNTGIVRCYHLEKSRTIQMLSSITNIEHTPVTLKTLGTSGTIRALIKKYLKDTFLRKKTT